jgi:hypothetical protein
MASHVFILITLSEIFNTVFANVNKILFKIYTSFGVTLIAIFIFQIDDKICLF